MGRHNRTKNLLAQQPVARILRLDQGGLDEVAFLAARDAARNYVRILPPVIEVLSDLGKGFLVDDRAHEIPEIGGISHANVFHDGNGAITHFRPDRFRNVHPARRRALLTLVLESSAGDGDGERDGIRR